MKIAITTESTCDLSKELVEKYNIIVKPLQVMLGEKNGLDGVDITPEEIFEYGDTHKDLPKTAALNEFQYNEFFEGLLKEYDAVVHIALSSKLSSSCQNAINVSKTFKNVYVVDSKSLSTGIGMQVIYAAQLRDRGLEPKEIVKKVEERRSSVQASFFVDTIDYLYKGGRCSTLKMIGAVVLRIKPQIIVKQDGSMVPGNKYFGRKSQVCKAYCEDVLKTFNNPDKSFIFITHTHANEEVVEQARAILKEKGFKNIIETYAGATITSHCGKGTLGILYYNDGGEKE